VNFDSIPLSRHPFFLELPSTGSTPTIGLFTSMRDYLSALSLHLMLKHIPQMLRVTLVNDIEHEPEKHRAYFEVMIGSDVMLFCNATNYSSEGNKNKALLDGLFAVRSAIYQVSIESYTRSFIHGKSAHDFIIAEQERTYRL
jgi:hypothetical protein